ncbi:MAG TPA: hypothetical protein VLG46_01610 [Anaerolineae bacterium]|nr:hypothetical protein [Anaerolineae bacterium]
MLYKIPLSNVLQQSFDPFGGMTALLIIIPIVIAVVVIFFVFRMMRGLSAGSIKNGVTAQGTILRTWDTGTTINENPVVGFALKVTPTLEPAFEVEMKQIVSRIQIGAFLPGATVEVVYDPADHKKVKIQSVLGMPGAAPAANPQQMEQMLLAKEQMYNAILSMGEAAQATILTATDMNIRINNAGSMMSFRLEVHPANKPVFQAETQGAIGDAARTKYAPGSTIWVKFNPNDLTQVALDHS